MIPALYSAPEVIVPSINVTQVIQQRKEEELWDATVAGGILNVSDTAKVLCGLSQQVERYEALHDDQMLGY